MDILTVFGEKMTLLIILVAGTCGLSFLCSMMEAALLSITPSYIAGLEEKNPNLYKKISKLKAHIDTPLSAILTLNTIANTAGAACIGAQVANVFGSQYVALASAIMTVLILTGSEIIPKTIGAIYWQKLTGFLCFVLGIFIFTFKPFILALELLTKLITPKDGQKTNLRDEIKALTKLGYAEKDLDDDEFHLILNTLNLDNIRIKDMMTPRNVCVSVLAGGTIDDFVEVATRHVFSRYPVMKNEDEEVFVGYVHKSDIIGKDPSLPISGLTRPILEIASSSTADYVFAEMLKTHNHIGVVYDELGTWCGIVTLEDILETILGKEIIDETDKVTDMRSYAKMVWSKKHKKVADL